jgi:DNA-binding PadR family transcriptional regulator
MPGLIKDTPTSPRLHWALAVLCLLCERPMHPYEMRRQMKLRHKDERLVLRPGSLYNAVDSLLEQGLVEAIATNREGRRPNRTIYRITAAGKAQVAPWLNRMVGEIRRDVSSFSVALDHLVHLTPAAAAAALEQRRAALATTIADMEAALPALGRRLHRINFIEVEHDLVLCRAQYRWLGKIVAELRAGTLQWNLQAIIAAQAQPARPAAPRKGRRQPKLSRRPPSP